MFARFLSKPDKSISPNNKEDMRICCLSEDGGPLSVFFKLPISEISEIDDHKSVWVFIFLCSVSEVFELLKNDIRTLTDFSPCLLSQKCLLYLVWFCSLRSTILLAISMSQLLPRLLHYAYLTNLPVSNPPQFFVAIAQLQFTPASLILTSCPVSYLP